MFAKYSGIDLTTVAQPCREIGKIVVQILLERLKSPDLPTCRVNVDFDIKMRNSSIIPQDL